MERRQYLATIAAALGATAGCTGAADSDASPTDSPTPTQTPTPADPHIADSSFEPRDTCEEQGSAEITVDGQSVVAEGCIVGKDGCQEAVLESATYDAAADQLDVRVITEKRTDSDACTQQLVDLPYTATVTFENGLPGTTRVVHDGVHGETEAARADTN